MKIKPLQSVRKGSDSVKAYVDAVKNGQHVVPLRGDWAVKKANSERSTRIFETQKEAIDYARTVAINQQVELSIHGKNGQIRDKKSYGKDSFPPRG